MSSVGSVIAQRPYHGKNFTITALANATPLAAYVFPTASVEQAAPNGAIQIVGSTITFNSVANATLAGATATNFLANPVTFAVQFGAGATGTQLRDMGRTVTVLVNGVQAYKLQLVQYRNQNSNATEGVGGSPAATAGQGYLTFYVVIESNLDLAAPGSSGVGIVGVARV